MIPEFAQSPFKTTKQTEKSMQCTLEYLRRKINYCDTILDVGRVSPLTIKLNDYYNMYNTVGDLDVKFKIPKVKFDGILYSHTIEHQFNPLFTLLELKKQMNKDTKLFIILPQRPKFLWTKGHYHEIDHYRMKLLLKRAGLSIISYEKHNPGMVWWFYFTGIRPILRLFLEFNGYYECKLLQST